MKVDIGPYSDEGGTSMTKLEELKAAWRDANAAWDAAYYAAYDAEAADAAYDAAYAAYDAELKKQREEQNELALSTNEAHRV
jgi:hypothetical protein